MSWGGQGFGAGGGGAALQSLDQSTDCYLTRPWRSCDTRREITVKQAKIQTFLYES